LWSSVVGVSAIASIQTIAGTHSGSLLFYRPIVLTFLPFLADHSAIAGCPTIACIPAVAGTVSGVTTVAGISALACFPSSP
jgi:hypothetical protein